MQPFFQLFKIASSANDSESENDAEFIAQLHGQIILRVLTLC